MEKEPTITNTLNHYNDLMAYDFQGMPIHIDRSGATKQEKVVGVPPTFLDEQCGNIIFRILFGGPEKRRVKIEERIFVARNNIVMSQNAYMKLNTAMA